MSLPVRFAAQAQADLDELFDYIAGASDPGTAVRYTEDLIAHCESLGAFPQTGTGRDHVRRGLRTTGFRGRVTIAFATIEGVVVVLGVFYGGRDYEAALS